MRIVTILTALILFIGIREAMAQTRIITGKVTSSEDKSPIPGVTVLLKGTSTGTSTNGDGKFTLPVPGGHIILVFSCIGMKTEEKKDA